MTDRHTDERALNRHLRQIVFLGGVLTLGIGGWAYTAELEGAVVASGLVIVENSAKKVQHPTGGVVSQIFVQEGVKVSAGDILVRLEGTTAKSNLSIVLNTLAQQHLRRARLMAEQSGTVEFEVPVRLASLVSPENETAMVESEKSLFTSRFNAIKGMRSQLGSRMDQLGKEAEGLEAQIAAINERLVILQEDATKAEGLFKRGLIVQQRMLAAQNDLAELKGEWGAQIAALAQARGKRHEVNLQTLQLDEDRRSEVSKELTEVEAKIAEYEDRRIAAEDQLRKLEIVAPVNGRIAQLSVHTVGGVIEPSENLMMVVPDAEALVVEARISTRDIDQVYPGQAVSMRFAAFNQQTTPEVSGAVSNVAPDQMTDQYSGTSYYPLRIRPSEKELAELGNLMLHPGMPVEVFIKTTQRTALSYIVKPLTDQLRHALREE